MEKLLETVNQQASLAVVGAATEEQFDEGYSSNLWQETLFGIFIR